MALDREGIPFWYKTSNLSMCSQKPWAVGGRQSSERKEGEKF